MTVLQIAKARLLEPTGISESDLERTLSSLLGQSIDGGDLYFQHVISESFTLEDGIIKDGSSAIEQGVGVRAMSGDKTGFAYSDDIILTALEQSVMAAKSISHRGQQGTVQAWRSTRPKSLYTDENPIDLMSYEDKLSILRELDSYTRQLDSCVKEVIVSLNGVFETILIVATDGTLNADIRPLVRLNVSVIVEKDGVRETASFGGGGRQPYQMFLDDDKYKAYAREALRLALVKVEACEAPAGMMPVVLGPGWPGVLLHEAVGHGLEGDFNRKETSAFSGRVGERVASPLCTIVDDGTLESRRGSLTIDDEGVATQRTVLIEDGILKGYMQDKMNAKLMKVASTGNGRRESYAHVPMPRMTNTFMLAGPHDPDEIIQSVKKGIYAKHFGGGQVDITSGKFVFSAQEAYLIENGRITKPIKGATLIGNGPEVMTKISMVGHDLKLDEGVGTCGKDGQSVPVGVGQPTLLVDELTVGGTQS